MRAYTASELPGARGDTLTRCSTLAGAEARKKRGWVTSQAYEFDDRWSEFILLSALPRAVETEENKETNIHTCAVVN